MRGASTSATWRSRAAAKAGCRESCSVTPPTRPSTTSRSTCGRLGRAGAPFGRHARGTSLVRCDEAGRVRPSVCARLCVVVVRSRCRQSPLSQVHAIGTSSIAERRGLGGGVLGVLEQRATASGHGGAARATPCSVGAGRRCADRGTTSATSKSVARGQLSRTRAWLDRTVGAWMSLENRWILAGGVFPAGISTYVIARKPVLADLDERVDQVAPDRIPVVCSLSRDHTAGPASLGTRASRTWRNS